jgi:hypothetical protein
LHEHHTPHPDHPAGTWTTTAPERRWAVATTDGLTHLITGRDVITQAGRITFFTGLVHDEVPEVAAQFRESDVRYWRIVTVDGERIPARSPLELVDVEVPY